MLTGSGRVLVYNAENQPTSMTVAGTTATMAYDFTGSRVTKSIGGNTTAYIGDLYQCAATCSKFIFANGERVAMKPAGGSALYYHVNMLGSTVSVTDSTGAIVERIRYYPFGSTYTDSGSWSVTHKYTGQELDFESGLYYYGARYYDPALGRFTQSDTMTSDNYVYARNNPIVYNDPTGHVATRYTSGFWSYTYNTPPKQGADTSLPNPALLLPPSWATPSGMNLGDMGASTKRFGTTFSSSETVVLPASTAFGFDRTVTTSSSVSGNELMARFVYGQGQYASLFSPDDVAQMTWDHSRFWDEIENKTTRTIQPFDNRFNEQIDAQTRAQQDQFRARATAMAEALARAAAPALNTLRLIDMAELSVTVSVCGGLVCTDLRTNQAYFVPIPQVGASLDLRYGLPTDSAASELFFPYRNLGVGIDTGAGLNVHLGPILTPIEWGVAYPIELYE